VPELPEVETTCRGVAPHVVGQCVERIEIRRPNLRWPITKTLATALPGQVISKVWRRAKYLLFEAETGVLIVHLGMTGNLRVVDQGAELKKHDHVDIIFKNGMILRYCDPRRFGAILWLEQDWRQHKLLKDLGPEPLAKNFDGDYLYKQSRKRSVAIKNFMMNGQVVVGVGNIYANEALFSAGIRPTRAAGKLTRANCLCLAGEIKRVLSEAIREGGTTLKDFTDANGKPGYFKQSLQVYGRGGQPCYVCETPLKELKLGQRATVFCTCCQT
jgi:formamidopyrimidine-DNA glycosylase